jgi:hypothetical protein
MPTVLMVDLIPDLMGQLIADMMGFGDRQKVSRNTVR